jgi:putative ABC transport system substrate-binding protein
MNRRDLILLLSGAMTAAPVLRAQQKPRPVIGWLGLASGALFSAAFPAFREGLASQGYVEGEDVAIVFRWAGGDVSKLPALAAELVAMPVDVIVATGGPVSNAAAQAATQTIPIVSSSAARSVSNFARPDANLTGVANQTTELNAKRLELLYETAPGVGLIGFLFNPASGPLAGEMKKEVEEAAAKLKIRLVTAEARGEVEFDEAFAEMTKAGAGACLVMADPVYFAQHLPIVALAARHKLPAIYEWREIALNGGLMAYGDSFLALFRRVGDYVGRILKGAKPADLPVEQPGMIRLIVNLKTAEALGLTVPPLILARADEIIE